MLKDIAIRIFFFKLEDKWMIAKSIGWDKVDSYEEAVNIIIKQQRF